MELSEKNSLNPDVWGSTFWDTLHFTGYGYPTVPNEKDKDAYKNFILNFVKILPCDKCSNDAQIYVNNISDVEWAEILKNNSSLLKWTWTFHDSVNTKLNKRSISIDVFLDGFVKGKSHNKSTKSSVTWKTSLNRVLLFVMFVGVALFYARHLRTTR
jgi:hypothetical protein|tara:strand:- start:748 stop:1218 length:471 start_codon:yes stop_codon:yes gene_type:complete